MLDFKRHPFAVKAHFDFSLVLTFAFPKEVLLPYVPEQFELDTYQNKYAFLAVALVKTKHLRPNNYPEVLGKDFILAGYRIFVSYKNQKGVNRRGLYILKSQTDKFFMAFTGNLFTHYNYEKVRFKITETENLLNIENSKHLFIKAIKNENRWVNNSIFLTEKDARKFVGPMPYTFTYDSKRKRIITVKGKRTKWDPEVISIKDYNIPFLTRFKSEAKFANAFITKNIDYEWAKGEIEYQD